MAESTTQRIERIARSEWTTVSHSRGVKAAVIAPWREIFARRTLGWLLVDRELRAKYKGSALGILWSLARPLTLLLIYFVAIGQFLGAARAIPDFGIFVLIGLTAWGLFSETVSQSSQVILANAGIIKKVDVPRELFPLSIVGLSLFNFAVQFAVILIAIVVVGALPDLGDLWFLVPSLFVLVSFSAGVAFVVSAVNVYIRDLQHLVDVAMAILFWLSPVVYSFAFVSRALPDGMMRDLYLANPVSVAVLGFQKALWHAGAADAANFPADLVPRLLIMCGVGIVVLLVGQSIFSRLKQNFAQEI